MIIPVRCFTCGKVIGDKWEAFKDEVSAGKETKEVLDTLGLERYCCRTIFLTHVDNLEDIAKHKKV